MGLNFILGIHCHQPVGNFPQVFEDTYQKSYLPFLEILNDFPEVKITVHYSGCLLDWIEENHPQFIDLLKKLSDRKQIEFLGSGYYEPILPILTEKDIRGQLEMMNAYLDERFSTTPKGIWLTERVWEPQLAAVLADAGVEYVIVDDYHFKSTGLKDEDLDGYYWTEFQNKGLAVFPINERLRYMIPFYQVHELQSYFQEANNRNQKVMVLADDGEKFGSWPGTYKWVYHERWLLNFFQMLKDNERWLNMVTFSDYMAKEKPLGQIYLPTCSYFEMTEWVLPAKGGLDLERIQAELKAENRFESYRSFLRGGHWRSYFSKYSESNLMHKKMLDLSHRLERLEKENPVDDFAIVRAQLYRGQCNCAYWHGVFGGLYLPHLRKAVHDHLNQAQLLMDKFEYQGEPWLDSREADLNGDGMKEISVDTEFFTVNILPHRGCSVEQLELKKCPYTLSNTLARREETYHDIIRTASEAESNQPDKPVSIHDIDKSQAARMREHLIYDSSPKYSFMDRLWLDQPPIDFLKESRLPDLGVSKWPYEYKVKKRRVTLDVECVTKHRLPGWYEGPELVIKKVFQFTKKNPLIEVLYEITWDGPVAGIWWFTPEINLAFLSGNDEKRYYVLPDTSTRRMKVGEPGIYERQSEIQFHDAHEQFSVSLELSPEAAIWCAPVKTVSQSESGFDHIFQGISVAPVWKLDLNKPYHGQMIVRLLG